jgi:hypothetical protein
VLATTGVIIGVGSLVAAFAITDGVEVWSRALIARESSVQDVAVTARTQVRVRGRSVPVRGYPELHAGGCRSARRPSARRDPACADAQRPHRDRAPRARATVQLTLGTASLADFAGCGSPGTILHDGEETHGSSVIVLGHRTATELAGVHDPLWLVGRTIRSGGERREVVGGVGGAREWRRARPRGLRAALRGGDALLEPSAAPRVPTLRLKARSIEAVDTLQGQVVNWLAERYGRGVEKLDVVVGTERLHNTRRPCCSRSCCSDCSRR